MKIKRITDLWLGGPRLSPKFASSPILLFPVYSQGTLHRQSLPPIPSSCLNLVLMIWFMVWSQCQVSRGDTQNRITCKDRLRIANTESLCYSILSFLLPHLPCSTPLYLILCLIHWLWLVSETGTTLGQALSFPIHLCSV